MLSQQSEFGRGQSAPTFSVLVGTYNHSQYILEALESVASQTLTDYELVIVNDGSTDDTETKVSDWIERFRRTRSNRVVLSTIQNSGQSAALEHGFGLCSGEYICLLDSDDRWTDDKLLKVSKIASEHPEAGMIVHPLYVTDRDGKRTGDVRPLRAKLSEGDVREQVLRTGRHVAPATSGIVISSAVFSKLMPMPTKKFRAAADAYLAFGASLMAPVRKVGEPLADYRMHPEGHHLQSLLSLDGLRGWVEIQTTIARHFGLERVVRSNSVFARQTFAVAKLEGDWRKHLPRYLQLVRATAIDPSFTVRQRFLLTAFWTACLVSPRPVFRSLWRAFQLKHTGHDKLKADSQATGGTGVRPLTPG